MHRARVLVVDDDPDFLDVARSILESGVPPFEVHTVETGAAAIARLSRDDRRTRPALVLLDFHLPDLDAPAVLEAWRREGVLRDLPVLVLSQADWPGDAERVLAAGATAFRVKPSDPDVLRELLLDFWRSHDPVRPADR